MLQFYHSWRCLHNSILQKNNSDIPFLEEYEALGSVIACVADVVSVIVVVDMLVMGRPDFACIEVRKGSLAMDSRIFSSTIRLVMPLDTLMVDVVLTEASRALLFLRSATMDTSTALAGTPSASDTLPTMACENDALRTSVELIPSNTW